MNPFRILTAAGFLLAGCWADAGEQTYPPAQEEVYPSDPAIRQSGRPHTRTGTIYLEGMPEAVTLELVEAGPFSTYIPTGDFQVEQSSTEEGTMASFYVNFGGRLLDNAYLQFFFFDQQWAPDLQELEELLTGPLGMSSQHGWTLRERVTRPETGLCSWAEVAYGFVDRSDMLGNTGQICIGAHPYFPFYMITHFPVEYGDGFGPRADLIVSEFIWADSGLPLDQ